MRSSPPLSLAKKINGHVTIPCIRFARMRTRDFFPIAYNHTQLRNPPHTMIIKVVLNGLPCFLDAFHHKSINHFHQFMGGDQQPRGKGLSGLLA